MSNPSGDLSDTVSDVIGNSTSSPGDSGAPGPVGDGAPTISGNYDLNARNRPVNPRNDRAPKMTTHKPTRTSSAPPEEHVADPHKMHFQPTKTHQSLSYNEQTRKPSPAYQNRPPAGNNSRTHDEASPNTSQGSSLPDTRDSSVAATGGSEHSLASSGAPSPLTGDAVMASPGMSVDTSQPPLSPGMPGGGYDRSSPNLQGQASPGYPNNANRNFRTSNGPPSNYNRDGQYNHRQGGPGGPGGDGREFRGDYRDAGGRDRGGRTNRRAQMQQSSFPRGAGNMMGMQEGPMQHMGPMQGGMRDMNRRPYGNLPPQPPPQFIAYDPYGTPQMVVPNQVPQGAYGMPGNMPGSVPVMPNMPGGMPGNMQPNMQGAMQGNMQSAMQGNMQGAMQGNMQGAMQGNMQGNMPGGFQQGGPQARQQQQQQPPQAQMFAPPGQQPQQMVFQQHVIMHNNQPPQQRFLNQQVFLQPNGTYGMPVEYAPEQMNAQMMNAGMIDMQNMQNMRGPGMGPPMQMQMQMHPSSYPMGMMPQQQPQQFQTFQQIPQHLAQHGQQIYVQQPEMMQYGPQGHIQMPVHMVPAGPQGPHMSPGGMPAQGQFVNYQHPQVMPAPHPGGPYNPNTAPQYGSPGGRPPHMPGQGQGQGQHDDHKAHLQRSPPPPRGPPPAQGAGAGHHTGYPPQPPHRHAPSAVSTVPSTPGTTTPAASDNQDRESASETASNADSTTAASEPPLPAKERKVLTFKKKDGSALDINSLRKPGSETDVLVEVKEGKAPVESGAAAPVIAESAAAEAEPVAAAPLPVPTPAAAVPVAEIATPPPAKKPEVASVPTVQEQLKGLQIEGPSKEEQVSTQPEAVSPIRVPSVPVSLSKQPASSAYSTTTVPTTEPSVVNASEPVIVPSPREVPAAPVSSPNPDASPSAPGTLVTPLVSRSKKSVKKEQWAKADLASGASSDLSAYVDSNDTSTTSVPVSEPSTPAPAVAATPKSAAKTVVAPVEDTLPDSWEDDTEPNVPTVLPVQEPGATKEVRSLRPGGNRGFNMNLHQVAAVTRFSKQEIIALKPTEKFANPLSMYGSITTGEPGTPQKGAGGAGQWSKGGRDGRGQGQEGGEGWKRGDSMPPAPSSSGKHKKSNSNVPMPKKQISDPMSLLATETIAILNKITPQTFEKLSQSVLALNVQNIAQMNKVIELIFEKAVQEQSFANLYAELCSFLNARALHWQFYTVFRVVGPEPNADASSEYFWIRECNFPNTYVGPYFSLTDCVTALFEPTLPAMQPLPSALETVECLLLASLDLLVKISRNDKSQGYYVTYMPFSDFDLDARSQSTFADAKLALKDAKNKNYFRAKLVTNCQTEFQLSTKNESMYGELEQEKARLVAQKAEISEADFFYKSADIDDRRSKLKRRMLGNIRFVGELFKQKLLTDVTIQACISDLMGTPEQWKAMTDEQDIECLCHLLRTAGERLEIKNSSSAEAMRVFNMYFDRLRALTRDKTLNSRMRFTLEEVLTLRESGWQSRRAQDGPLKISEIHRKIQEEERTVQQFHPQGGNPRQGGGGPMKGNAPPQGQQGPPGQQRSILPRPPRGAQDVRQDARKGGGAPAQDVDKFGRTMSASGYEGGVGRGGDYSPAGATRGPPQGGDALRRVQSEYSPSSGTATPTSVGSGMTGGDGRGHVRTASEPSNAPVELDFTDKKMANRAKSAVSEYLDQRDVGEVKLFLSEGPRGMVGYFVLQLIDKCLNSTKEAVVASLRALLAEEGLGETFRASQLEVFQALRSSEELKCLVDTTMDVKEAPEKFASVIAALMKVGALGQQEVQQIVQEARTNCIEELMSAEEDCSAVFDRFAKQLSADLNS